MKLDPEALKAVCTGFFRYWWNKPGANTNEGYDDWAAGDGKPLIEALTASLPQSQDVRALVEELRRLIRLDDTLPRYGYVKVHTDTLHQLLRALSCLAGEGWRPKVKPLDWRDHRGHTFPDTWTAKTPCGVYEIEERSGSDSPFYVVTGPLHAFIADKDGLPEAKADAQADYERRILSALDLPAPSVEEKPTA